MPSITLNWTDNSTSEEGQRIYRSTSPMTVGSLPAPLATISPSLTSYVDSTVSVGTTYYYRVSAYSGSAEAVSSEVKIKASTVGTFVDEITADTPYMWWRMGESSGTTLADSSGNSRTATISGTAGTSYQLGQTGLVDDANTAIRLLDDNGYIRSSSAFTFALTNFAQAIAFRANSGAAAGVLTMMNQNATPGSATAARDRGFILGSDGKLYYQFYDGTTSRRIASLSTLNDGNRHIAHAVIGTTTTKFFIDGALQGSLSNVPGFSASCYMYVGRTNMTDQTSPINTNGGFRGIVDEMVYFNHTLTDARVLVHAQASGIAP